MTTCNGRCLCGIVTYQTKLTSGIGAGHCSMCRRWSGGLFMSVQADESIEFTGAEHMGRYASSDWAERVLRTVCGTNLCYHRLYPTHTHLKANTSSQQARWIHWMV